MLWHADLGGLLSGFLQTTLALQGVREHSKQLAFLKGEIERHSPRNN